MVVGLLHALSSKDLEALARHKEEPGELSLSGIHKADPNGKAGGKTKGGTHG